MGGRRWWSGVVVLLVGAPVLAACTGDPHPAVGDDHLACASATETGRTIGRGQLGPADASDDERTAALLLEVATLQFALGALTPEDAAVADATAAVQAANDPADAVDAVVRLSATCQRVEVPIELEGAEHTTAACTQLRSLAGEPGGADGDDGRTLGRLRFTARYAQARLDDLDDDLATSVRAMTAAIDAEDRAAVDAARTAAADRCATLQEGG